MADKTIKEMSDSEYKAWASENNKKGLNGVFNNVATTANEARKKKNEDAANGKTRLTTDDKKYK